MTDPRYLRVLLGAVLVVATVSSAIGIVFARHEARRLFIDLQQLNAKRDELNIEWGRLQIEHSAWANPGRIEQIARERLMMADPDPASVVIVKP
jgi:cell division protein FtsL